MEQIIDFENLAGGGAWRNEAMQNIKKYLVDKLKEMENVDIIS